MIIENVEITIKPKILIRKIEMTMYWDDSYIAWSIWKDEEVDELSSTEQQFNEAKSDLLSIAYSKRALEELIAKNVVLTKKGLLSKRSNQAIYTVQLPHSYDDTYGSHSYKLHALVVKLVDGDPSKGVLVFDDIKVKDTF